MLGEFTSIYIYDMDRDEFIKRSIKIHGNKYDYTKVNYISSNKKVIIMLDNVEYYQTPSKHLMGRCPEKNTPKISQEEFIKRCINIWGNKYDYSLVEYKGMSKNIKVIYNDVIFEQNAYSHLLGHSPENRISNTENFIRISKKVHKNRYDYSMTKFNGMNNHVLIGYKGIFYKQSPTSHIRGRRPELVKRKKTNDSFIQDANNTHNYKYLYDKVKYIKNNIKVVITCPLHGDFEQTPQSHLNGQGCLNCKKPKGIIEISKFLSKNNILFEREKKFIDCINTQQLPFDFYIPSFRACIEFNEQISNNNEISNIIKTNNDIKNKYCEDNFINLITINQYQVNNIWDILWDNLKILIRLKKIK